MTKRLLILAGLFGILPFITCDSNTSAKNNLAGQSFDIPATTDDLDIIGHWSMCSEFGNGVMTTYNVCPIVIFNSNGTGSINNMEPFNWIFQKGRLYMRSLDKTPVSSFPDSAYYAFITKDSTSIHLTTEALKGDGKSYLGREKH